MMMAPPPQQTIVVNTGSQLQQTMDPNLQCHFADCANIGTKTCRWNNAVCRSKKIGGCQKKYCDNHKHTKVQVIHGKRRTTKIDHNCCLNCESDMAEDMKANAKCQCYFILAILACFCCIPIGMILRFVAFASDSYYYDYDYSYYSYY